VRAIARLPASSLAQLVALVLVGTLVGASIAHGYGPRLLLAVGVLVCVAVSFRWPLAGCLIILAMADSVVGFDSLPSVRVGGFNVHAPEIVLGAALLGTFVDPGFPRRPSVVVWLSVTAGFLAVALLATMHGLSVGTATSFFAFAGYRPFLYLALALVLAACLNSANVGKFLDACGVLVVVTGAFSLAAMVFPPAASLLDHLAAGSVRIQTDLGDAPRPTLSGLALVYVLLLPLLARAAFGPRSSRRARLLVVAIAFGSILVSLNRDMWIGAVLGMLIAAVIAYPRLRGAFVRQQLKVLLLLAAVGVALIAAGPGNTILARGATLLSPTRLSQSSSLQDRFSENHLARQQIHRSPWLGLGAGGSSGATQADASGMQVQRHYVHNQYLEIALFFGIPAAMLFFGGLGIALLVGVKAAASQTGREASALYAGSVGATVGLLASSFVYIGFSTPATAIAAAVLLGLLLADLRVRVSTRDD
jgi:hypothetical protein